MKRKITAIILMVVLVLALAVPMAAVGASPGPDLVGLWHMDEGSGATTIADSSGNGNTGTVNGATSGVAGKFDQALSFDGDDGVSVADSSSLDFSAAITIEAWVYQDSNTGVQTVAEKRYAYYLNIQSGKLRFYWYGLSNPGYHISPNTLPLNTWTHVAGTYDGSTVKLYENGAEVYSANVTGTGDTTDTPLGIGYQDYLGGVRFFNGEIDEVRIWDEALTSDKIGLDLFDVTVNAEGSALEVLIDWSYGEPYVNVDDTGTTEFSLDKHHRGH